jgi:hypothetical protein
MSDINANYRKALREWVAYGIRFALVDAFVRICAALPTMQLDSEDRVIAEVEQVNRGFMEYMRVMEGPEPSVGGVWLEYRDGPIRLLLSLRKDKDRRRSARLEGDSAKRRVAALEGLLQCACLRVEMLLSLWEDRSKMLSVEEQALHFMACRTNIPGGREELRSWWILLWNMLGKDKEVIKEWEW